MNKRSFIAFAFLLGFYTSISAQDLEIHLMPDSLFTSVFCENERRSVAFSEHDGDVVSLISAQLNYIITDKGEYFNSTDIDLSSQNIPNCLYIRGFKGFTGNFGSITFKYGGYIIRTITIKYVVLDNELFISESYL